MPDEILDCINLEHIDSNNKVVRISLINSGSVDDIIETFNSFFSIIGYGYLKVADRDDIVSNAEPLDDDSEESSDESTSSS